MSSDLTFDSHIDHIVKAGQKMSAWAQRTFKSRKVAPMLTILKSLVRSKAEYASILWSPTDSKNIQRIESVQRRFTDKIAKYRKYNDNLGFTECVVSYADRLKDLKLYSLQRRRERFMLCYMFKVHIGSVPDLGFLSDDTRNGPR